MVGGGKEGADHNVPLPGHAVGVQEADVGEVVGVVGVAAVVGEAQQQLPLDGAQLVDRLVKPLYRRLPVAVENCLRHRQHWFLGDNQVSWKRILVRTEISLETWVKFPLCEHPNAFPGNLSDEASRQRWHSLESSVEHCAGVCSLAAGADPLLLWNIST